MMSIIVQTVFAQPSLENDTNLGSEKELLSFYNPTYFHEKISVFTDKEFYRLGEAISVLATATPELNKTNKDLIVRENRYPLYEGDCGIPYLAVAFIPGSHPEINSFEKLFQLKDEILNVDVKDPPYSRSCMFPASQEYVSVRLSPPLTRIFYLDEEKDNMSEDQFESYRGFFKDGKLELTYSNATLTSVTKSGGVWNSTRELWYSHIGIKQHYDKFETRELVSTSPSGEESYNRYLASHPFEVGSYTLVGFTMSGSISKPAIITVQQDSSISNLSSNVLDIPSKETLWLRFSQNFFHIFTLVPLAVITFGGVIIFLGLRERKIRTKSVTYKIVIVGSLTILLGFAIFGFYIID